MSKQRRYVRQMPKIYGNLQKPHRSYAGMLTALKRVTAVGLLVMAVYGIFFSGLFSIRRTEVQGTAFSDGNTVKAAIPIGKPIWAFSTAAIQNIAMSDRAVESVAVLRGLPDSVKVIVVEKTPAVLWLSGDTASVLDTNGRSFYRFSLNTPPAPGSQIAKALENVPRVVDTKNLSLPLDAQVGGPTFVVFIDAIRKQLATYLPDAVIDHMEISETTYDLTVITKAGMRIQFNTLADAGVQARNLARLVTQKKIAANASVDLRIDRWAYVHP